MLRLNYEPSQDDRQQFDLESVDHLQALEAEAIEEAGGAQWRTFVQWSELLNDGSFRAWRVLLWIMLRRRNPDFDLNELRFPVGALTFEFIDDEPEGGAGDEGKGEPAAAATDSLSPEPDSEPSPSS